MNITQRGTCENYAFMSKLYIQSYPTVSAPKFEYIQKPELIALICERFRHRQEHDCTDCSSIKRGPRHLRGTVLPESSANELFLRKSFYPGSQRARELNIFERRSVSSRNIQQTKTSSTASANGKSEKGFQLPFFFSIFLARCADSRSGLNGLQTCIRLPGVIYSFERSMPRIKSRTDRLSR